MKSIYKKLFLVLAFVGTLVSCSKDDESAKHQGNGEVEIYFDNTMNGNDLVLGQTYTNSNGEEIAVSRLNYVISNIVLFKADGTTFVYPKEESYFIISEENEMNTIHLTDVPAGEYVKVKFGIGVDQQRYLEGESAQQEFWDKATQYHMTWSWNAGYKFLNYEGTFTSHANTSPLPYWLHVGNSPNVDNYSEVILEIPAVLKVQEGEVPNVHIMADANVILDGANKIELHHNMNDAKTGTPIMGGEAIIRVRENFQEMFAVDHVHNHGGH